MTIRFFFLFLRDDHKMFDFQVSQSGGCKNPSIKSNFSYIFGFLLFLKLEALLFKVENSFGSIVFSRRSCNSGNDLLSAFVSVCCLASGIVKLMQGVCQQIILRPCVSHLPTIWITFRTHYQAASHNPLAFSFCLNITFQI